MNLRRHIERWLSRPGAGVCLLLLATTPIPVEVGHAESYRAKEVGRHIELTTPQGNKVLFGDFSFDTSRDYKIRIPLKDLMAPKANSLEGQLEKTIDDSEESGDEESPARSSRKPSSLPGEEEPAPPYTPKASDYDDTDRLIVEANHFYNKGKFYEATIYVEELIRKKPKLVKGWVMKGSLLYVQGHKDLAKKAWEQARALEPGNPEVRDLFERYKLP